MAKALRVISWNVEHFKGQAARVQRVVGALIAENPDVFALYEVEGSQVFTELTTRMPGYSFHITEGPEQMEILVGVKRTLTAFFTQRTEFKSSQPTLRPGALLTCTVDGEHYSLLFLHTKSGDSPRGFGLRDDMLYRAAKFQSTLDGIAQSQTGNQAAVANYIFMGDLNTMGMEYPYVRPEDIEVSNEMLRLERHSHFRGMTILSKDEPHTFWNGPGSSDPPSNLDHVVATSHLAFRQFAGHDVSVLGWPKLATDVDKAQWIGDFSDHAYLKFEVQKV